MKFIYGFLTGGASVAGLWHFFHSQLTAEFNAEKAALQRRIAALESGVKGTLNKIKGKL